MRKTEYAMLRGRNTVDRRMSPIKYRNTSGAGNDIREIAYVHNRGAEHKVTNGKKGKGEEREREREKSQQEEEEEDERYNRLEHADSALLYDRIGGRGFIQLITERTLGNRKRRKWEVGMREIKVPCGRREKSGIVYVAYRDMVTHKIIKHYVVHWLKSAVHNLNPWRRA